MMQIVYFDRKEDFISHVESLPGDKVYVTPSPAKADGLRTQLPPDTNQDVITIAKFTGNLVQAIWSEEERPEVKRKSELLLIFGILKNKYLPDLGFEQFTQAYNLFSDLRSFTLNQDTLTSVMEEQSESVKQAVELFWKLLELTGYHDEHSAYHGISERLRSIDDIESLHQTYIFWGFQHLNGQQVDLLKALSIRYQVVIPFPLSLKEKLKKSDWISWVKDSKTLEVELKRELPTPKGKWISINSREISQQLKDLLKPRDQIVLGLSKLTPSEIDLVPSQRVNFKIPHQILATELKEISHSLKKFQGTHQDLLSLCEEKMKGNTNLKLLRGWQLYHEALSSISNLTDEVLAVDSFFLKLLSEIVNLNQPRTSFVPTSSEKTLFDLKDMSSLEDIDPSRRVVLCIDDRFDEIQGLGQNYTESIQKSLSALGPLKRNELELLFKKWAFQEIFLQTDVLVLMNEGTLKHSLVWKRLFAGIDLEKVESPSGSPERKLQDHFDSLPKKIFEGTFSASKLQTYLDCPRKFYFNYVDKIFPDIQLKKDFDPMTSGTIIHEIIEEYFKNQKTLEDIPALTQLVMEKYIQKEGLTLPPEVSEQRKLIFNHRSSNGIQFIHRLDQVLNDNTSWEIEKSFEFQNDIPLKGRMDCVGVGDRYIFLLDFKSTDSSAASNSEVSEYLALQLWVYALASKMSIEDFDKKNIVIGYVVLDDPSKSNLLSSDEEFIALLKKEKMCSTHRFKEDFHVVLDEARNKIMSLKLAIEGDESFKASPRIKDSCTFCELNKVCVKSELTDA